MKTANLSRSHAQARAGLLRVRSYDVTLDLTDGRGGPGEQTFTSRTVLTFDCERPGEATFVDVMAEELTRVMLNDQELDLAAHVDQEAFPLAGLAAQNVLVVEGRFAYADRYQGMQRTVDPVDGAVYLHSTTFMAAARHIFCCFDQPDLKATFAFHVTAPTGWQVLSNAAAEWREPARGGGTSTHFPPTRPIPTYITAVMAGPYHHASDTVAGPEGPIPLGLYCMQSSAAHLDVDEVFAVTKAGFDFFHRAFGYPYPFGKYDQVFAGEPGRSGMENAGLVALGGDFVFRGRVGDAHHQERAYVVLHELAHMWFGDLVTTRWWDDTWLNEAFATYAGYDSMVASTSWSTGWTRFAQEDKTLALFADQLPSTHPIAADIPELQTAFANFDNITYAKGASVLRQLVAYVGRDAFFRALQGYFRTHEYANTELGDLLSALEAASGRDLSAWSREWLQTAHVNTLRPEYTTDAEGRLTSFAVHQSAAPDHPTLRSHRLAIGLYDGAGALERRHRVELDVSGERTEVPELIGQPRPALVLVNDDDLTYAKLRFDPHSLHTLTTRIGDLTDSLARSLSWTAAWDMTRDGELTASEYLDMVLGGIHAESDPAVLTGLLDNLEHTLHEFSSPERASRGLQRLADAAWTTLTTATPGGEEQLVWSRCFARVAASTTHARTLRGVYDGDVALPGIALDFDTLWSLLHGLASAGLADLTDITSEVGREPSPATDERAAKARALIPAPEVKERVWAEAMSQNGVPLDLTAAGIDGFCAPGQSELLAPYVARYFESLDAFWAVDDGGQQAQVLTRGLFPRGVTEPLQQEAVALAESWLSRPYRPSTQRRRVDEGRHELVRALTNRRIDR